MNHMGGFHADPSSNSAIRRRERFSSRFMFEPMILPTPNRPVTALPYRLTSQLATELYDRIIHFFHDSKTTLSKFSTVNAVFLRLCRQHLFFSLNLRPGPTTQLLSPHALETVVPHIRSVALGGHWITEEQEQPNVMELVKCLVRLEQLQLETWTVDSISTSLLRESLATHYQTLTILDLKYIRFPSFLLLIQFIGNLIMLEDLSLDNVTWDRRDSSPRLSAPESTASAAPSRLKKLDIVSCHNSPILSWFSRSQDLEDNTVPQIEYLRLPELLPKEAPLLAKLLRDIGPALRHLELGILPQTSSSSGGSRTMHEAFGSINLGYNTGLRTLGIHQITLYQLTPSPPPSQNWLALEFDSESPYANVISLLSSVSPQLEEATFYIWLSEDWHLDWINWAEVAGALSTRERTCLHRLGIRVRGMGKNPGDVRAWIGQRLQSELISSLLDVSFDD